MVHKKEAYEKARRLRKEGASLKEIAEAVGASKSSISSWTKDIPLLEDQKIRLRQKTVRAGHEANQRLKREGKDQATYWGRKRRGYRQQGYEEFSQIGLSEPAHQLLVLAGLYWGEGSKGRNDFRISNSDPGMIEFVYKALTAAGVGSSRIRVAVHLHEGIPVEPVVQFWASLLVGVVPHEIKVYTAPNRRKNPDKGHKLEMGVCYLRVAEGMPLRQRVEGWIEYLKNPGA